MEFFSLSLKNIGLSLALSVLNEETVSSWAFPEVACQ
jgi:hypothetical protein